MLLQKLRNGFRRVAAGKPCVAAGADALLRRSPRVVLPQISSGSRPADFGGRLAILGGNKLCSGSGYRRSAAPLSPALYCCRLYPGATAVRRFSKVAPYTAHCR